MAILTKKDLLEAIEDMPMDSVIVIPQEVNGVRYTTSNISIKCEKIVNIITLKIIDELC